MTTSIRQKLTLPLIGMLLIVMLVVAGFIVFNKFISTPIEIKDVQIDTQAALKLSVIKQISKKNGITEWELTADTATLLNKENKAVLVNVCVIFHTKGKKKVHLESETGILNTKTHDMKFSDHVIVTYEDAVLRTDQLQYNKKKHIIFSNVRVRLEKQNSVIEGDSMTTHLNTGTVILKGNVKGQFSENFKVN